MILASFIRKVGGGYKDHDLADISLTWMVVRNILKVDIHTGISDLFNDYKAHVNDSLAMDMKYLGGLLDPMAPWGTQKPHECV